MTTPNSEDELDPARLERLMEDVSLLPREVAPTRDAWPAIRQRIEAQRVRPIGAESALKRRRTMNPWLMGIAATLIATAGVWWTMSQRAKSLEMARDARPAPEASANPGAAPIVPVASVLATENPSLAAAIADYQGAAKDLEEAVARQSPNLSPATREVVRRSLAIIDTAIADLNSALGQNPRDAAAGHSLSQAYARKLEFLKRVRSLPGAGM